jgi:hypothetical protein
VGISAGLAATLMVAALAGVLAPLERALAAAMASRPLPAWYFLLFILLGALLPLGLRWLHRARPESARVLDPYLVLLAGQILTEGLVTRAGGKGLGVLVGMVFTLIRLWQLKLLWPLARRPGWLRRWLVLELVLWGGNALQMLAFRWWPLLV